MNKKNAIEKLESLINQLDSLPPYRYDGNDADFDTWYRETAVAIEYIFGQKTRQGEDFSSIHFELIAVSSGTTVNDFIEHHYEGRRKARHLLKSLVDEIRQYWSEEDKAPG